MKKSVQEFKDGIHKFVGRSVNKQNVMALGEFVREFIASHPEDEELLLATMINDFENPYAKLDSMLDESGSV
jgi:hypothetical protein